MKKIVKTWMQIVAKIANDIWWPWWSSVRWDSKNVEDVELRSEDVVSSVTDISRIAIKLYKNFTWTSDDASQLFDSIVPPPQNYQNYLTSGVYDDCDGFHSALYHILYKSGISCYLLSVNAIGAGHCVLLFKCSDLWYVCDYTSIHNGFQTAEEAIQAYNRVFIKYYATKSEVFYNGLTIYDYDQRRFRSQSIKEL